MRTVVGFGGEHWLRTGHWRLEGDGDVDWWSTDVLLDVSNGKQVVRTQSKESTRQRKEADARSWCQRRQHFVCVCVWGHVSLVGCAILGGCALLSFAAADGKSVKVKVGLPTERRLFPLFSSSKKKEKKKKKAANWQTTMLPIALFRHPKRQKPKQIEWRTTRQKHRVADRWFNWKSIELETGRQLLRCPISLAMSVVGRLIRKRGLRLPLSKLVHWNN